ncbi:MAG: Gfo/Idh/MocA family oxidoreductase [Oscillospiraceae bacterium]|jgi:predicted dehydrogenase|nr:Gfo/Idh/MocA family oxidoreductase [Oscillospiraceae bacterium]
MKEINVALIGTGIIANEHVGRYRKIEGVNIIAACDLDEVKLNAFCDKWNIPNRYTDYREMLERDDIIAVDVCLHNNLHAPISVAVMAAGKNCYCEKPMAGSYIDAVAMKNAAAEFNVKLHIQLSYLFTAHTTCAKKIIDAGRLGNIYHTRSYGYRRRGRPFVDGYGEKEFVSKLWAGHGALFDMGVYHISQLLYLLDTPEVERVSGAVYQEVDMDELRKAQSGYDVEELGVGFAKLKGGLTMDIMESWAIHGGKSPPSSIHGSNAGLQIYNSYIPEENKIVYLSEVEGYPAETSLDIAAEQYRRRKIDPSRSLFNNSQAHWIGVLRGDCEPIDTANIGLQTMLISEGIFISGKLGREVTAEEISSLSKSNAISRQDAPFGELVYPANPFI